MTFEKGSRINIWKQDPTVEGIGIRTVHIPRKVFPGPRDSQITIRGLPELLPDKEGDFLYPSPPQVITTDIYNLPEITPVEQKFDASHTYAVARQVLTMFERILGYKINWVWNQGVKSTDYPLEIYPHANKGKNAYYERDLRALKFEYFYTQDKYPIFMCRSLDIISHEMGHAIFDSIKPFWNIHDPGRGISLEIAALQESICDLSSMLFVLSRFDLVDYIIAQTKSNLKQKDNILAVWSEQIEVVPGVRGARNAINDLKLTLAGTQVHRISGVFTGAIYDSLSDIFDANRNPDAVGDSETLYLVSQYILRLLLESVVKSPDRYASFADLANEMIKITKKQGEFKYSEILLKHFIYREILDKNGYTNNTGFLQEQVPDYKGCYQEFIG